MILSSSRSIQSQQQQYTPTRSLLEDEKCTEMHEQLKNDEQSFNSSNEYTQRDLQKFIAYLREYEVNCALKENYKEAKSTKLLSDKVKHMINASDRLSNLENTSPSEAISNKNINGIYRKKFEMFDKETQEKKDYIIKRQEQNLDKFEELWSNTMPNKYRKASAELLKLKDSERKIAMEGDYEKAMQVHQRAEALAKKEIQTAQTKLVKDYKNAKAKLIEKQQKEIHAFEENRNQARKAIAVKRENEIQASHKRNLVLQQRQRMKSKLIYTKPINDKRVYSVSVSSLQKTKRATIESSLLPPLLPPTDPRIEKQEEERRKEALKRKKEIEAKNEERMSALMNAIAEEQRKQQEQSQTQLKTSQKKPRKQQTEMKVFETNKPDSEFEEDKEKSEEESNHHNKRNEQSDKEEKHSGYKEGSGSQPKPYNKDESESESSESYESSESSEEKNHFEIIHSDSQKDNARDSIDEQRNDDSIQHNHEELKNASAVHHEEEEVGDESTKYENDKKNEVDHENENLSNDEVNSTKHVNILHDIMENNDFTDKDKIPPRNISTAGTAPKEDGNSSDSFE